MNGLAAKSYWTAKMPQVPHPHTELNESIEGKHTRRRSWVTKHITSHFSHRKKGTERSTIQEKCPRCLVETEDKLHILWCPAPSARAQ